MEAISTEEREYVPRLSAAVQNGKLRIESKPKQEVDSKGRSATTKLCRKETVAIMPKVFTEGDNNNLPMDFPTTFVEQTTILLKRRFKQMSRCKITILIMLVHHFMSGLLVGAVFIGVGNDASRPFDNARLIMTSIVFCMYTHIMINILLFPTEVQRLRREYFNRWYGFKSYFVAQTLCNLPNHVVYNVIYSGMVYVLTDQPLEFHRMAWFYGMCVLTGIASEGLGIAVGSIFKVQSGSAVGPMTVVPMLAVAVYGMGFGPSIEPFMKGLMYTSYLRSGIVGLAAALYRDRPFLRCDDAYCHYQDPNKLLIDLGMADTEPYIQALHLCGFIVLFRAIAYLALRYRLSLQFSTNLYTYLSKILGKR